MDWISAHVDRLDPFRAIPTIPADPEISPEDLKPYLNGWSVYGPEGGFSPLRRTDRSALLSPAQPLTWRGDTAALALTNCGLMVRTA
jgi:hypothetical protein